MSKLLIKQHKRALALSALLALFSLMPARPALACDCDEPVIIDGIEAYSRSLRHERDPVEGFWGIYMDWQPERGASIRYRMAVVKNDYGVYEGADYIGVVTCDKPGCKRGEVKLLLKKTDDPRKFDATLLVTDTDGGRGTAVLREHESADGDGRKVKRKDSALDLSDLKYKGKQMTYGMLRIMNG